MQPWHQVLIITVGLRIGTSGEENSRVKILIVDDEPLNIQVLANNLLLENYALAKASSGREALAL